jgi:L-iditol 2-dehydrogenase
VKALRFHGPGDLRLEEVPRPEPGEGDVLVQVEVALTDGTDLKTFRRGHPLLLGELPSPFGHEFCGVDVASGRRVVAANSAAGDERAGRLELLNGAYAEFILVPAAIARVNLLPVPRGLAPEVAALTEPLACCLRGVERAEVADGDRVAIVGAGPIGLMLCACVRDAGGRPEVAGGRPERRALVPAFGGETGDGGGADVVIEAAGTEEAWQVALELVRPGGTVLYFGGRERGSELRVDTYRLHYEELTLRGSFHHAPRHVRAALTFLASGAYPWERLITHRVGLDGVAALFADPPRDYLKAAVYP